MASSVRSFLAPKNQKQNGTVRLGKTFRSFRSLAGSTELAEVPPAERIGRSLPITSHQSLLTLRRAFSLLRAGISLPLAAHFLFFLFAFLVHAAQLGVQLFLELFDLVYFTLCLLLVTLSLRSIPL